MWNRNRIVGISVSILLCLVVTTVGFSQPAPVQSSDEAAARAQARFRELDVNADALLSGREVEACRCAEYDTDRDGKIPKAEFYLGFMLGAFEGERKTPAAPVRGGTPQRFRPGDRVEVNVDGTWYVATVTNAQENRYHLVRDDRTFGVASSEEWINGDRLRAFVAKPVTAAPPTGPMPNALPVGMYTCMTYQSGGGQQVGKLRILNGSASSGVTPDGSGPQHTFTYTPATGAIAWAGGLQIVSWTVERAEYRPTTTGIPNINLHYRLRPGGNLNSMSCQRG